MDSASSTLKAKVRIAVTINSVLMNFLELIAYIYIFHSIYRHNKTAFANKILNQEVILQRHKKNAITLIGQLSLWCLQVSTIVMGGIFATLSNNSFTNDLLVVFVSLEYLVVPIIVIQTSPPIRQFIAS